MERVLQRPTRVLLHPQRRHLGREIAVLLRQRARAAQAGHCPVDANHGPGEPDA